MSVLIVALLGGCATAPGQPTRSTDAHAILVQSARESSWPVEGESRPGIWIRLSNGPGAPGSARELVETSEFVVEHGSRRQTLSGGDFTEVVGSAGTTYQTRYLYTPLDGTLFITTRLRAGGRHFHSDTQRIELNDDCWNGVFYRVRGEVPNVVPHPPPWSRTVFLTPPTSGDPPLYLEISASGNCFRRTLVR